MEQSKSKNELLVAQTQFPYSRTLFHHDGTEEVKGSTKPGDAFKAGTGRVSSTNNSPVLAGDPFLNAYLQMRKDALDFPNPVEINSQFFKTTIEDENGKKSISYQDKSGHSIINLYFGSTNSPITTSYQLYDQADRLVVSVSPNGVKQYDGSNFNEIDKTQYEYNHKGWLLTMTETDAGKQNINIVKTAAYVSPKMQSRNYTME